MKKSIKVFTLSLLATGMLVGCGADPVPAPDWSAEQKQEMKEILYGEVLPYVSEVTGIGFRSSSSDGLVVVTGDEVSPEQLASYAGKFTEEAGWTLLGKYTVEDKDLSYTYEKELTTQEGARHVQVQFGGIDQEYKFIENGSFMLLAMDPYYYSYEDIKVDVDLFTSDFDGGEFALPAITGADRYETYESDPEEGHFLLIYCYSSDATLVEQYYDVLSKSEDNWKTYPAQEDPDDGTIFYMADSPDGKYGIQYFYDADHACMIVYISDANYLYSFPQAEMNAIIAGKESESTLPAGFAGDRFRFIESYGATIAYFDANPEKEDAGYGALLEEAGWTVHGFVEPIQQYVATSADGKVSVRYYYEENEAPEVGGVMIVQVTDPAFTSELPSPFKGSIPDVEGATKYVSDPSEYLLGIYYESEAEDGGYSALLSAAEFTISEYSFELENGSKIFFAFEKEYKFLVAYNYYDGCLSIAIKSVSEMEYLTKAWPAAEIAELNTALGYYNYEVPALTVASENAEFYTYVYTETIEFFGKEYEIPVGTAIEVEGATQAELEAYVALFNTGWTVEEGSTLAGGAASREDEGAAEGKVSVEWFAEQDADENWYFGILLEYVEVKPTTFEEYPAELIAGYFQELGLNVASVPFGDYATASEEAYFEPYLDTYGDYAVDVYGTTSAEQGAFVAALVELGWTRKSEVNPDYPNDAILTYGNTGIYVSVVDWLEDYECVTLTFYYDPTKESDEFPLTELNDFLAEYELGFSLTSALPTAEGEGYVYKSDESSGYHYFKITLSGDQFNAVLEALVPILTANGYSVLEGSVEESDITYQNDAEHQVNVYTTSSGDTVVVFWE